MTNAQYRKQRIFQEDRSLICLFRLTIYPPARKTVILDRIQEPACSDGESLWHNLLD